MLVSMASMAAARPSPFESAAGAAGALWNNTVGVALDVRVEGVVVLVVKVDADEADWTVFVCCTGVTACMLCMLDDGGIGVLYD